MENEEQKLSKLNRHKVESQWRKILRLEKLDDLKKEVQVLAKRHDEEVEKKDSIIKTLLEGFEDSEDQFRRAFGSHLQSVDELIDVFDDRLLSMERDFEDKLESLQSEYNDERRAIVEQYEIDERKLLDKIATLKAEEERREAKDKRDRQQMIEEIKNRNMEDMNGLRFVLDSKIEDLEEQFEAAHLDYLQKNDHRTADYQALSAKDKQMRTEIEDLMSNIERLQISIKRVQSATRRESQQRGEKIQQLLRRKNTALERYQSINEKMNQSRDAQHNRIAELTKCANQCKTSLQEKCDLAERILKLVEVGQKLEADQLHEGGIHVVACEATSSRISMQNVDDTKELKKELGDDVNGLDCFWRKYNKALMIKNATSKRVERLKEENKLLKNKLKHYKDGISVNDDAIMADNPLLVINGRMKPTPDALIR